MNNIWSGLGIGLFVGAVATRHYYGGTTSNNHGNSQVFKPLKPFERWSALEKAEFILRLLKQPLKIVNKSVKAWLDNRPQVGKVAMPNRSWISYATGPNALTVYTLFAGIITMSYQRIQQQDGLAEATLATRATFLLNTGMSNSTKIMHCYLFINTATKFLRDTRSHAIPMIFAATMVGVNCWRNE